MAKRRRMYVQSVEEKMMFRLKDEHKCSINEAWKLLKKFQFHKEMQRINNA
jgi:hypothetical protein